MNVQKDKANECYLKTIQFELSSNKENVFDNIICLRKCALKNFDTVSKIFRLDEHECKIKDLKDSFLEIKLMSHKVFSCNSRVVSCEPKSVVGFAIQFKNGYIGYMALAVYPEYMKVSGKKVRVPDSDKATWSGLIYGLNNNYCESSYCAISNVFKEALHINVLSSIKDPFSE